MNGEEKDVIDYVKNFRSEFDKLPFEKIAFPRGVKVYEEYLSENGLYRKATPAHVRAAIIYNHFLKEKHLTTVMRGYIKVIS